MKSSSRRFFNNKKGQVVTEYLHTYGWVLLVVMVLGGILINYNIKSTSNLLPKECVFYTGIECLDFTIEDNLLKIELVNEFGFAMSNITADIKGTCNSSANTSDTNPYFNPRVMLANAQNTMTFECQNLTGLDIDESINISYRNAETDNLHWKVGQLKYRAREE